ncbi:DUF167 domain-containing protein [Pendulispora brunnea]|uniref:UPF0235 protein LZC95_47015 n=1 Tax=Pendulispora brunnea TaxID=2905690 RepID=A0ABZ2K5L2_9BACT
MTRRPHPPPEPSSVDRSAPSSYRDGPGSPGLSLVAKGNVVRFAVHARPRAKESAILGVREGALDVRLAAPPVDGLANEELVRTLAEALRMPQKSVRLVRGTGSREKQVEVDGLSAAETLSRLERFIRGAADPGK